MANASFIILDDEISPPWLAPNTAGVAKTGLNQSENYHEIRDSPSPREVVTGRIGDIQSPFVGKLPSN